MDPLSSLGEKFPTVVEARLYEMINTLQIFLSGAWLYLNIFASILSIKQ